MRDMDAERLRMLHEIQEAEFTALELQLFLDTHPDHMGALHEFNQAAERLAHARRRYEERYGPLLSYGFSMSRHPWQWVEEPWPWEIEYPPRKDR